MGKPSIKTGCRKSEETHEVSGQPFIRNNSSSASWGITDWRSSREGQGRIQGESLAGGWTCPPKGLLLCSGDLHRDVALISRKSYWISPPPSDSSTSSSLALLASYVWRACPHAQTVNLNPFPEGSIIVRLQYSRPKSSRKRGCGWPGACWGR